MDLESQDWTSQNLKAQELLWLKVTNVTYTDLTFNRVRKYGQQTERHLVLLTIKTLIAVYFVLLRFVTI